MLTATQRPPCLDQGFSCKPSNTSALDSRPHGCAVTNYKPPFLDRRKFKFYERQPWCTCRLWTVRWYSCAETRCLGLAVHYTHQQCPQTQRQIKNMRCDIECTGRRPTKRYTHLSIKGRRETCSKYRLELCQQVAQHAVPKLGPPLIKSSIARRCQDVVERKTILSITDPLDVCFDLIHGLVHHDDGPCQRS